MTYTSLSLYLPFAARTSALLYIRVLSMILNPHRHLCFFLMRQREAFAVPHCAELFTPSLGFRELELSQP